MFPPLKFQIWRQKQLKLQNRIKEIKLTPLHAHFVCASMFQRLMHLSWLFFLRHLVNYHYNYYDDYCYCCIAININQVNAMKMEFNAVLDRAHTHIPTITMLHDWDGEKRVKYEDGFYVRSTLFILYCTTRMLVCTHRCNCLYFHSLSLHSLSLPHPLSLQRVVRDFHWIFMPSVYHTHVQALLIFNSPTDSIIPVIHISPHTTNHLIQ